jgi:regulator of sirC expression with transglutaminase-like and TPR domain
MGIFDRKKEESLLEDPSVIELEKIHHQLQIAVRTLEDVQNLANAESVFKLADQFAFHYVNNCPKNFMLRLNHESMTSYRKFSGWILDATNLREWALGAYILLKVGKGNSLSKEQSKEIFESLTKGMTPLSGHYPSLDNALESHGMRL